MTGSPANSWSAVPFCGSSVMNSRTLLRSYSGPVSSQATGMVTACPLVVAAVLLGHSGRPSGAQSGFVWMSAPVASGISKRLEPSARTITRSPAAPAPAV